MCLPNLRTIAAPILLILFLSTWIVWRQSWNTGGRPGLDSPSGEATRRVAGAGRPEAGDEINSPGRAPDLAGQAERFCGGCHAMPPFDSHPKAAWRKEVLQGYEFYEESGRSDLVAPEQEELVSLFESRAPDRLLFPDLSDDGSRLWSFQPRHERLSGLSELPALAHLNMISLDGDQTPWLVYCDMQSGEIGALAAGGEDRDGETRVLANLINPCHVEPCDLDNDGVLDLVVADLGSFVPADHDRGRVVWLRRESGARSQWKTTVLLRGLGRVADVEPIDFDCDGDLDLLVAEFGWRKTGRIVLLEQRAPAEGVPQFEPHVLDRRHGTIHVPVADLNDDGRPDFVALISQEHEVIEAFLNEGAGGFRREVIYEARNPAFGSSGIQLVDLDGDGDLDVLYTNGDAMDGYVIKPYHGVQWLENKGAYPFEYHHLAVMPGAARALAGDLDGDGRLDVAAVAFLPDHVVETCPDQKLDSILVMQQGESKQFRRRPVERSNLQHMSLALVDVDGDGLLDLVTGNFAGAPERKGPRLTVWRNLGGNRQN